MTDTRYTALVLAASRGNQDPLAIAGGVSHKCFIDIHGQPMLRRVVEAVAQSGRVKKIIVQIEEASTEEAKAILAPLGLTNMVFTPSSTSIGTSVNAAVAAFPDSLPLIITTGDNALHTGEMVKYFCDQLDSVKEDGALGLTPASYVLEKYPEGNRAFHRFRDGQFSSCNLYALLTPKAVSGAKIFNTGGQFGKKPNRLIQAFGVFPFLLYKSRLATLRTVMKSFSGILGMKTAPVLMPFAEGPIDVDRQVDWDLANRIIAAREGEKPAPAPEPVKAEPAPKAAAAKPKPAPAPNAEVQAAPRPAKAKVAPTPTPEPEVLAARKKAPAKSKAAPAVVEAPAPAKKPAAKKPVAAKVEAPAAPAPEPEAAAPAIVEVPAPKKPAAKKPATPKAETASKPAAKKAPAPKTAAKVAPAVAAPAPEKAPAARKPAAKAEAAPKPVAKKAAAPKPAAAKPAAAPAKPATAAKAAPAKPTAKPRATKPKA